MKQLTKVLVTGATGFVGRALALDLYSKGYRVTTLTRRKISNFPSEIQQLTFEGLETQHDLDYVFDGIDTVIHCAARVHVMCEKSKDPLKDFRIANVEGTRALAMSAARSGVKRFIFLSTIKVNGEATREDTHFKWCDPPQPEDPYGVSKWEAEQIVHKVCASSPMHYVIIRPVLVYGPGVKANFEQLIKLIEKGAPLPLKHVRNKRSLVSLDNLIDLISTCIESPVAEDQTFLISDGANLSTCELASKIAHCFGKKSRVFYMPATLLKLLAMCSGRTATVKRLTESLQVDIAKTCDQLDWRPPYSTDECLQKMVDSRNSR